MKQTLSFQVSLLLFLAIRTWIVSIVSATFFLILVQEVVQAQRKQKKHVGSVKRRNCNRWGTGMGRQVYRGGGFKNCLFSSLFGETIQFD